MKSPGGWLRVYFIASLAAVGAGLSFGYGVAVGTLGVFPYRLLQDAAAAARDWIRYPAHNARLRPEKFLAASAGAGERPAGQNEGRAFDGLTFVDGFFGGSGGFRLIDMDGMPVHEWQVSFKEIWPDAAHIDRDLHDWDAQIHGAVLYPNGDVVFNFQYAGLVRIDRCARTKWKLPRQTHHSVFEDAEGNLWVPSRTLREEPLDSLPAVSPPFYEDHVLKVSPDGTVLREFSVLQAILDAGYEGLLLANGAHGFELEPPLDGDFTHLNDVEILSPGAAKAFPRFSAGDIMVSLRNLNLVLVLDSETLAIKWSMTGPYLRQHDPDFLPNGRISVFDNRRDGAGGERLGGSRILQIDPLSHRVEVRYPRGAGDAFYTATMGDHQYLGNGNLLVTESESGRAFEIAPSGDIVWSYVNRWDETSAAQIGRAIRVPKSYESTIQSEGCQWPAQETQQRQTAL